MEKKLALIATLILVVAVSGSVVAYMFWSGTWSVGISEPLQLSTVDDNISVTYPGDSDNIVLELNNVNTERGYGLFVNIDEENLDTTPVITGDNGRYYKKFEDNENTDFNGDGDFSDFRVNIGQKTLYLTVVATVPYDASPGSAGMELSVYRGEPEREIQIEYVGGGL